MNRRLFGDAATPRDVFSHDQSAEMSCMLSGKATPLTGSSYQAHASLAWAFEDPAHRSLSRHRAGVIFRPALPRDKDVRRAFVRDLSDEARYYRFMTRLSELHEAMAERFTTIDHIGHVVLVAEVFTDASATMTGEARYIDDAGDAATCVIALASILLTPLVDRAASSRICRMSGETIATNEAMVSLLKRSDFATRKPEADRLVHLLKGLPADNQRMTALRRSCVSKKESIRQQREENALWPVGHRTPVSIPRPAWL